jgi:putative two-component system response regulator
MKIFRLLIVDDEASVINALTRLIKDFSLPLIIESTTEPQIALNWITDQDYDILLTDQRMPIISGLDLIDNARTLRPNIQCLLMSGHTDFDIIVSAINDGHISGFIMKPWNSEDLEHQLQRAIAVKEELENILILKCKPLSSNQDWLNAIEQLEVSKNGQLLKQIKALSVLIHAKDYDLYEHSLRVSAYSMRLGKVLQVSEENLSKLELASMVHDLGKIAIRDSIHYKPGALEAHEYLEMKRHPQIGAEILTTLEIDPYIIQIVEQHHERVDGKGYPKGLSSDDIVLGAKILSVADAYDALISDRIYRKGLSSEEAIRILESNIDILYDVNVVAALIKII